MKENALSILDLRDIVIPTPASIWPPAPFVWILLGMAGIGLAVLIWRGIVNWKAEAYRREGIACLDQIEKRFMMPGSEMAALKELSLLLKRVALAVFERKTVAALFGEEWLRFLDQTCGKCSFSAGSGHLLTIAMSSGGEASLPDNKEAEQLIHQARNWIKGHRRVITDQRDVDTIP